MTPHNGASTSSRRYCPISRGTLKILLVVLFLLITTTAIEDEIPLKYVGRRSTHPFEFPLGPCEGHCESQSDCQDGLSCVYATLGDEIPGCTGNNGRGRSYCSPQNVYNGTKSAIRAQRPPTLLLDPSLNIATDTFNPRGLCQGPCIKHEDCKYGLNCYRRISFQRVPGCRGNDEYPRNYCYRPDSNEELVRRGKNGEPEWAYPLKKCQGDCNGDEDCGLGLVCHRRDAWQLVPGCEGRGIEGEDYCAPPVESNALVRVMERKRIAGTGIRLNECRGECIDHHHCQKGLFCFHRQSNERVPGCTGRGIIGGSYCYKKRNNNTSSNANPGNNDRNNNDEPRLDPVGRFENVPQEFPLGNCEGHCRDDQQCRFGLSCFRRNSNERVPGCKGNDELARNYCYKPPPGTLVRKGDDGDPKSAYPLRQCQSDCDGDKQCGLGLICWRREGNKAVPGCSGAGIPNEDYCVVPPESNTLVRVVLKGDAIDRKAPLKECQGECTRNEQCQEGLKCWKRKGTERIPGCSGRGIEQGNYCYRPRDGNDNDNKPNNNNSDEPQLNIVTRSEPGTLSHCEGPCFNHIDCKLGYNCYQRKANERVPGCRGNDQFSRNYCYKPPSNELVRKGHRGEPDWAFPLKKCQGDCDGDETCNLGLICWRRDAWELVPGCEGPGIGGEDYCTSPPDGNTLVRVIEKKKIAGSGVRLGACKGECIDHHHCQPGLRCFKRDPNERNFIPGCSGRGITGGSYCYKPKDDNNNKPPNNNNKPSPTPPKPPNNNGGGGDGISPSNNVLKHTGLCTASKPCSRCEGNCASNNDNCQGNLICFSRTFHNFIPGCKVGGSGDVIGVDYCSIPAKDRPVTYLPGLPNKVEAGLLLSKGLTARVIAVQGKRVRFDHNGQLSKADFHLDPDGAAVFEDRKTGIYKYVSNAESTSQGGVGALVFNARGQVIGYEMLLMGTKRNCGGGKTFWNTWLTCEETEGGQVWEVDPWGRVEPRQTIMGIRRGDKYESAAYDNRNPNQPKFYITTDDNNGPVLQFTPDRRAVSQAHQTKNYFDLLHSNTTGTAKTEFLVLQPNTNRNEGTFYWTDDLKQARQSASRYYKNCEGIDIRFGMVYFACKQNADLFILDLDQRTYTRESTKSGAFNGNPDQVARILGGGDSDAILYFCEAKGGDARDCGVHGRDAKGNYYTILENAGVNPKLIGEVTGLAFSPNNMYMYLSFQKPGFIFEVKRRDGYPFGGGRLDIQHHSERKFQR